MTRAGFRAHAATGTYRAATVIVTVPPPMAARIEQHPALPAARIRLQDNTYMGSVHAAIAVYDRPFWRDHAHAELLVLTEPGSTSPPAARRSSARSPHTSARKSSSQSAGPNRRYMRY
ncbi:FAD-dependent oxidoreductase [Nocardia salmonicida]|uniref:FAD-dependent oxidoreductase n=1 Tax=Nocardia salmonicida TaxID=53431 RepID=UPI003636E01D